VRLQLEMIHSTRQICFVIHASGELQYDLQLKCDDIILLSTKLVSSKALGTPFFLNVSLTIYRFWSLDESKGFCRIFQIEQTKLNELALNNALLNSKFFSSHKNTARRISFAWYSHSGHRIWSDDRYRSYARTHACGSQQPKIRKFMHD
jgi:hypothetical protein